MMTTRQLLREEITQVWNIDRSEFVENIYRIQRGQLVLQPHNFEVPGWPPGEAEKYTPIFLDCFDRGGWLHGAFDDGRLVAVAVLESRFIESRKNQLQLTFFHVGRPYRNQGLGARLFRLAAAAARERGAARMYISATPSEHTVNFYMRLGCVVAGEPDPELLALEPDDIHLELEI